MIDNTQTLEDSRLRYRENATLLLKKSTGLSPLDRDALWKFLASDCSLVVISTPDLEAAYRIFSVLNNRGLDLAPIDILKASILGSIRKIAGEPKSHAYAKKWSQIESKLGREAFGDLFGAFVLYTLSKNSERRLLNNFMIITEYNSPIELIDNIIAPYSEVWDFIRHADFEATEHAESINDTLSWLNRIDFKDWVPPAILYFKKFKNKPAQLNDFCRELERLTYFMVVTRIGINDRIETFAALTKEIEPVSFKGDLTALTTLNLSAKQQRDFITALDGDIYRQLPKARMALVLRLEALVSDGSKKQIFDQLSLEHVLPQTPGIDSEWMSWFPDEGERDYWTHRLANLVPLHIRKNPSASNFDFRTKKNVYFTGKGTSSPFILTNEARAQEEWNPAFLFVRQKRLVTVLSKHWDLDPDATEADTGKFP